MQEYKESFPKPKESVTERVKRKLDYIFHPASSASREAFNSIIAVLPPGEMKKSMELVVPQLKDLLKTQDRSLAFATVFQRAVSMVVLGGIGLVGGAGAGVATTLLLDGGVSVTAGAIVGAAVGIGAAFVNPSVSQMERSRIAMAAKQQEMMLRTSGGKEAAKVFDAKRVDDITKAILWGTAANGGTGGVLGQAANPLT